LVPIPSTLSGYSVDRRRVYVVGEILPLTTVDPYSAQRPLVFRTDDWLKIDEIAAFIVERFPEGMSRHGWEWMTSVQDYVIHQPNQQHYIRNMPQIELVCELVRRSHFPSLPTRFQSYFAYQTETEAENFKAQQIVQTGQSLEIYELASDNALLLDQEWLRLGYSPAMSWAMAHRYWSGIASKSPKWELLMGPSAKVVRQIS
jgi:hypothetical protein